MSEPLDLAALCNETDCCVVSDLVAELRATRAERDALHLNHDAWDDALARAERAEAALKRRDDANFYAYRYLAAIKNERIMFAVRDKLIARAERAEAEVAQLQNSIARVEALLGPDMAYQTPAVLMWYVRRAIDAVDGYDAYDALRGDPVP